MSKNYIFCESALEKTYFKNSLKTAIGLFLLGTAVNMVSAQNLRVAENTSVVAKMSYNQQVNSNLAKLPVSPFKTTAKKAVALAGLYTVGVAGNYATLTAAVSDFNSAAITRPVMFELLDATYSSETFPIIINANAGSSATNTLTITPAT